jgi:carboxypeptidase C (cathepsin A)
MTDLVFIDPIGTGFSRAVKGDKPNDYWGWTKDVESIGDFIRLYVSRNQRWGSPKFIAGESYGTTRTTGLSDYLSDKYGMYLNGIILVSTALDFATLDFNDGNDLPYILYLPSYAATAWYHKKLKAKYQEMPLEKYLEEVRHFAGGEYLQALFNGSRMAEKQIEQVADKTANYIGLTREYVLRANLRVTLPRFSKELLRSERRTVGRYDGRFIGIDRDAAGEEPEDDPAGYEINGTFAGAFNDYICRELGYKTDLPYAFSTDLWKTWSYKEYENKYVQLEEVLRKTMVRNKFMKVWVLNGYYDMATPFYASEYVFSHLQLDPVLQPNLSLTYYEAGHMMYIHKPSLEKFRKDAEFFFENALKT